MKTQADSVLKPWTLKALVLVTLLASPWIAPLPATAQTVDKFQPEMESVAVQEVVEARTLVREKQLPSAVDKLATVTEQHPDYYRGHYNLGLALAKSGRPIEALDSLARAADIQKAKGIDDTTLLSSIGWTHYLAGNYQEARKTLEMALEQEGLSESSRVKILNNLGTVHKRLGAFDDARSVLQQSAASGSARAAANLKVIDATQKMQINIQRSLPFKLDLNLSEEVNKELDSIPTESSSEDAADSSNGSETSGQG